MTEETLFAQALQRSDPTERAAFLDQACAGDAALRTRVEDLLKAHAAAGSFLEHPVSDAGGTSAYEQAVATTPAIAPAESAGMRIGPYKLLQKLGEGGMGAVWLAEQSVPVQRRVALKLIKAGMDSAHVLARFEAERQALALMDHPNIARVFDAGTTGEPGASATGGRAPVANAPGSVGRPYFVMELVKGVPITKFCDQERLSPRERLELFIPVCQAVQHAHQKGIIHRDLKPSNVLIALYDGKPVPKVIDFGVAKATSQKLTEQSLFTEIGAIVGTLEYMAPEQAELNNLDIDTRADIYSLGVLLYELLTGSPPFSSKQLRSAAFTEMLRIIREVEPSKPSTKLSSSEELPSIAAKRKLEPKRLSKLVQGDLDWIVMKCLEKERSRRYETANGLAVEIQRYLADEPVLAGPPSAAYRLRKFVRRNQGPVLAAAVVLFALLGGMAGTSWGLVRAEQSREAEAEQRQLAQDKAQEAVAAAEQERLAKDREAGQRKLADDQRQLAETRKREAEANEEKAIAEKKIAEAVRTFLQHDLLRQADATEQANTLRQLGAAFETAENPTIKELLDRAAEGLAPDKIESSFPGQKEVQASILRTVGDTYHGIGQYDKAVMFLERARDTSIAALGPEHRETLATLNNLAAAYHDAGKLTQAIELYKQVRDVVVQKLGTDHPNTLTTLCNLADAYADAGKTPQAIELYELVRDARMKKLGADHPATLTTLNNLATVRIGTGKPAQAIELFEQVRDTQLKRLGADHPTTLTTMNNLAVAYLEAGKTRQAIELLEQVRDVRVKKLGAGHPSTLVTLVSLAEGYLDTGKPAQAIELLEPVRDASVKKLGPNHPHTLITLNNLARAYQSTGKLPQAIELFEQVRDAEVRKLGPDHPTTLITLGNLATAYLDAQKLPQAIELLEQVRDAQVKRLGADHPSTLATMNNLASAYFHADKLPKAIELFEQVRDAQVKKFGADHPFSIAAMNNLGSAYQTAGRVEQALPLVRQAARGMESRKFQHEEAGRVVGNLIDCHETLREYPEAETWRRKWLAVVKERQGPESLAYAAALTALGSNLLMQKKWSDAEQVLRESLALRQKQAAGEWTTFNTQSMLGGSLLEQKKHAEAEPLLLQGYQGLKEREAKIPPPYKDARLQEALQRLVQLYEAWDKPEEAAKWKKELEARQHAKEKQS